VNLTCAFELTGGVAGNDGTIHACSAHIHALIKLFCIIFRVALGDTRTLLVCVSILFRTRCQAQGQSNKNTGPSQSHGGILHLLIIQRLRLIPRQSFLCRIPWNQWASQLPLADPGTITFHARHSCVWKMRAGGPFASAIRAAHGSHACGSEYPISPTSRMQRIASVSCCDPLGRGPIRDEGRPSCKAPLGFGASNQRKYERSKQSVGGVSLRLDTSVFNLSESC